MGYSDIAKMFVDSNIPVPESVARHVNVDINCNICALSFSTIDNRKRHIKTVHGADNNKCPNCLKIFKREDCLQRHLVSCRAKKEQLGEGLTPVSAPSETALGVSRCECMTAAVEAPMKRETDCLYEERIKRCKVSQAADDELLRETARINEALDDWPMAAAEVAPILPLVQTGAGLCDDVSGGGQRI